MNYSELSDFEINKAVAKSIGAINVRQLKNMINEVYCEIDGMRSFKDFCNNPSDAWPIIFTNNICITFRKNKKSLIGVYNDCPNECAPGKELREAMIVYLMMQEDK